MGQPLDKSLRGILDFPYTISFCIKKALQIQSFYELPKDKIPPERIWFDEEALEEWFDALQDNRSAGIYIDEDEIE